MPIDKAIPKVRTVQEIDAVFTKANDVFTKAVQEGPAESYTIGCKMDILKSGKALAKCTTDQAAAQGIAEGFEQIVHGLDFGPAGKIQRFEKSFPVSSLR